MGVDKSYGSFQTGAGDSLLWIQLSTLLTPSPIELAAGIVFTTAFRLQNSVSPGGIQLEVSRFGSTNWGVFVTVPSGGGQVEIRMVDDHTATGFANTAGLRPGDRPTVSIGELIAVTATPPTKVINRIWQDNPVVTSYGTQDPTSRLVERALWSGVVLVEFEWFPTVGGEDLFIFWEPPPPPFQELFPSYATNEDPYVRGIPGQGPKNTILRIDPISGRRMYEEDMVEDGYRVGTLVDPDYWDAPDRGHRPMVGTEVKSYV